MATVGTRLHTWLHGAFVGDDEFGNRYYMERRNPKNRRRKRWVIYKGAPEASKVPAYWHGWLHYTSAETPSKDAARLYAWQKPHQPNLTGTTGAYLPPGHLLKGGERAATASDYVAWKPE